MGERSSDCLHRPGLDAIELCKPVSIGPELINSLNVLTLQQLPGDCGQVKTFNGPCAGIIEMGHGMLVSLAGGSAGSQPPTPVKRKSAISNDTAAPERMLC